MLVTPDLRNHSQYIPKAVSNWKASRRMVASSVWEMIPPILWQWRQHQVGQEFQIFHKCHVAVYTTLFIPVLRSALPGKGAWSVGSSWLQMFLPTLTPSLEFPNSWQNLQKMHKFTFQLSVSHALNGQPILDWNGSGTGQSWGLQGWELRCCLVFCPWTVGLGPPADNVSWWAPGEGTLHHSDLCWAQGPSYLHLPQ